MNTKQNNTVKDEKIKKFGPGFQKMREMVEKGEVPYYDIKNDENNNIVFIKKYKTPQNPKI